MSDHIAATWHYEAGQWTETQFFEEAAKAAGSWSDLLSNLGYEHYTSIGSNDHNAFSLTLYQRAEAPQFVIEWDDCNIGNYFTANRLPDAMELLARYAPIVTAAEIAGAVSDIRSMDPCGIVTDVLASARVNESIAAAQATNERRAREEDRRARREALERAGRKAAAVLERTDGAAGE